MQLIWLHLINCPVDFKNKCQEPAGLVMKTKQYAFPSNKYGNDGINHSIHCWSEHDSWNFTTNLLLSVSKPVDITGFVFSNMCHTLSYSVEKTSQEFYLTLTHTYVRALT